MSGHQTTSYFLIFLFIFVANSQITPGNNLHAFLTSSYYYPKSQSLGDDSIALVFSMRSESIRRQSQILTIFAENHTSNATINTTIEIPNGKTTFPIFPTTSTLPNMTKLSLLDGQQKIEIPFSTVSYEKNDVVVCISPQILAERYQLLPLALQTYKRYGAFVNMYVTSMRYGFFNYSTGYEKLGFVKMQPWILPRISKPFFENFDDFAQLAHTDCLLQFKESSKFVAFLDLNELLIPRLATNYHDEFANFVAANPTIDYLQYNRYNYETSAEASPFFLDVEEILQHLKYNGESESPRIVIPTHRLNVTWSQQQTALKTSVVPNNSVIRMKKFVVVDLFNPSNISLPFYLNQEGDYLMKIEDLEAIGDAFDDTTMISEVFLKLPGVKYPPVYVDLIENCIQNQNINNCKVPEHRYVRCAQAVANFQTKLHNSSSTFYYLPFDTRFATLVKCSI
ncbi:unnamed protein product [Caenorhabditis bovis]|uniref:Glycosyltransferase family 92 protein n=1 Tax=Caenorhabditis bovis TaxID=2654633 RepID=A0A8S1FEW6_9PELO|nr:unnamed protein product [Caenorhabditis bovis]